MKLLRITAVSLLVVLLSLSSYADDSDKRSAEIFMEIADDGKKDHVLIADDGKKDHVLTDLNQLEERIQEIQRERSLEKARKGSGEGQGEGVVNSENADLEGSSSGE